MRKKTILVLGAGGFLASKFIHKYKKKYKIISSFKSRKKSNHKIFSGTKKVIENILTSQKIYNFGKIDLAIYSVALNTEKSAKNKVESKKVNYDGIKNFCKKITKNKIKNVIKLSTIKVYGQNPNFKINERSIYNPQDNYSRHILKSDLYFEKFCKRNDINYKILRVSNGFGVPAINSKESLRVLLNNFVYQATKYNKISINSKYNIIKNFIRIEDIVKGIDFFVKNNSIDEGTYLMGGKFNYNLYSISNIIKKNIQNLFGNKTFVEYKFNKKKFINKNFNLDTNKLSKLGYSVPRKEKEEIINLIKFYIRN